MPKATANTEVQDKVDLKSCPGGWVQLRRLTFGEMNARLDMAGKMSMQADQKTKTADASIEMAQAAVVEYEFGKCIVDHNLEDDEGNKLDFTKPAHVRALDPRIGEEISTLIDDLNQLPEEELGK